MSKFTDLLKEKILILDGAMGTMFQKQNLTEEDFRGEIFKNSKVNLKGNNDVLALTKPDALKIVHRAYLEAGADIIETNTFSSTKISQKDYHLENYIEELNTASIKVARKIADEYSTDEKPRFVAGSIGPTNKTASISPDVENPAFRDVTFDELVENYSEQAEIFIKNGNEVILLFSVIDIIEISYFPFPGTAEIC